MHELRLSKKSYYIKPCVPSVVAEKGTRVDKQGGAFLMWGVWGGSAAAWDVALQLAGWVQAVQAPVPAC